MDEKEFVFIPEGDQHVIVPISEADGKTIQDIAQGYRGAIEWSLVSHDGSNVILYFINEKDVEEDEQINYNGWRNKSTKTRARINSKRMCESNWCWYSYVAKIWARTSVQTTIFRPCVYADTSEWGEAKIILESLYITK